MSELDKSRKALTDFLYKNIDDSKKEELIILLSEYSSALVISSIKKVTSSLETAINEVTKIIKLHD